MPYKYFRPNLPREMFQIIAEQAAKALRLYGSSKSQKEWLVEAILEKKAREDELEAQMNVSKPASKRGTKKELVNCT